MSFNSRYARLQEALGVVTQEDMAKKLGVTQPAISKARKRRVLPADWLLTILHRDRINPDWIMFGDAYLKYMIPSATRGDDE